VAVKIDLHTHTYPASSCSITSFQDYVARCRDLGLEAIALTNHGNIDDNRKLEGPLADIGVLLVHGVEISTIFGDYVVFSPDLGYLSGLRDVQELPRPREIPPHAAVVWVHPAAGGGRSGAAYYKSLELTVAPVVDAIELYNGAWLQRRYINEARRIADELGLPTTGGSDAHRPGDIMACFTEIPGSVRSTADVVTALKAGRVSAGMLEGDKKRRFGLF
jgi:predicted metal-dependent phosphoesterase TrpH